MRDFGSKRSSTSGRNEQATVAGPGPGNRTLTEMLLAASSPVQRNADAVVQRKADAAPAMPTAPRPNIADLFGRRAERQPSAGREPDAEQIYGLFGRVERKETGTVPDNVAVHASVQQGITAAASPLPRSETIQRKAEGPAALQQPTVQATEAVTTGTSSSGGPGAAGTGAAADT